MDGFIKLPRSLTDWEWYKDQNTKALYIHFLYRANFKDCRFCGIDVPRGSFVSSFQKLSEETGLSVKQIRTSLKKLENSGNVAHKGQSKYTVFTVFNMETEEEWGKQRASKGQAKGNNRRKKEREEGKNIYNAHANKFNKVAQRVYDFDAINKKIMEG